MRNLFTICFIFFVGNLIAQDAYHNNLKTQLQTQYNVTGGTWVFASNEATNATNTTGGGTTSIRTLVNITGQGFTKATQLEVTSRPTNPWDASLQLTTSQPLVSGDRFLLVFWARTISAPNNVGMVCFEFMLNASPYTKFMTFEQRVGTSWKQYIIPFSVNANVAAGAGKFMAEIGAAVQSIQIAGVTCINYKQAYSLTALPTVSNDEYVGMEANATWRAEADARIDQYRKANIEVNVTNNSNIPVPGAQVKIEMLKHEYPFGVAIDHSKIAGNSNQNDTYEAKLKNLDGNGHGFNEVVFENGHKWASWDGNWGGTKAQKAATVNWLANNGINVRGHALVWPGWSNSPADLQSLSIPDLKARINSHLEEILPYPEMGNLINDWDVINEFTGNVDIANKLKGSPGYTTGREIYVEIFNKTKQIKPSVKGYLNEAHITNMYVKSDVFRSYVKEMVDAGVTGINVGFQCHFRYFIPPVEWYNHLTDYSNLTGGLVKITEYDQKTRAPKNLEAQYLNDLMTITFSHPRSDGFLMWGFWDGAHYANRAPLFDINWNVKPEGQPFIDLVFNKWWTNATPLTGTEGKTVTRGFKGMYKITVSRDGKQVIDTVQLSNNLSLNYKLDVTVNLRAPENPTETLPGLNYNYYENDNISIPWNQLPNFTSLTPRSTGTTTNFLLSAATPRADHFGYSFNGYVDVPTDGVYTFYTSSDDGSRLYIGSTLVVDNDGAHSVLEKSGAIGLKRGKHAITVNYFDRNYDQTLTVSYQGPGITKKAIPASALYRGPIISGNLIPNGNFSNGLTGWELSLSGTGAGTPSAVTMTGYTGNVAKISVTNGGTSLNNVQFRHLVPIKKDRTYTITFKASAASARTISLIFQQNVSPWTTYCTFSGIDLTTTPKPFGPFTFKSAADDPTNLLKLLVGSNISTVYFDDVVVTESTLKSKSVTETVNETANSLNIINVYPNPATDVLYLENIATMGELVTLKLFDLQGRLILEKQVQTASSPAPFGISLQQVPSGTYFLRINNANHSTSKIIVVQK